jgi:hypothetical protein
MSADLEIVTTVSSEPEAALVVGRLADAGIRTMTRPPMGALGWSASRARDVYVAERDLVRAREVLSAAEGVSEEELTDEEESAARGGSPA